jgi:hypothetical protein
MPSRVAAVGAELKTTADAGTITVYVSDQVSRMTEH